MEKLTHITIWGAGAIGCTLAARLILAGYQHVSLVARGENLAALIENGISLKDLTGEHHVRPYKIVEKVSELNVQDVIFICTKSNALKQIVEPLKQLIHSETVIIPLMNGIPFWYFYQNSEEENIRHIEALDSDQTLIKNFPLSNLIGAVVFITAELKQYGQVESSNPYLLILGEPQHKLTERSENLKHLFKDTKIEIRISEQIRDQIWTKVIANLSSNPLSVVTGATLKDIYSHPFLQEMTLQVTQEVRQVAACYGARISIDPYTFLNLGTEMGDVHTSMWQDYKNQKPLEMAGIAQSVLELAEQFKCPMPMTKSICNLTQYLSEKSLHH